MSRKRGFVCLAAALACLVAVGAVKKPAKKGKTRAAAAQQAKKVSRAPAAPAAATDTQYRKTPYVGALSGDPATGAIWFADNADRPARPASVTKLMTALLVLEDVRNGKYGLEAPVTAGPMALRQEPSIIGFVDPKTKQPIVRTVDTLLHALMIHSANDAAVALAEHSAGTMEAFVARMNARAKALGMTRTEYFNPNGLPPKPGRRYPWKSFNVTTCRDQFLLAREIVNRHPEMLRYTSCKTWVMPDGVKIINHNNVMRMDKYKIVNPDGAEAIDGLKTGYIDAGGSSVVLTGKRNGRRVIAIVLGSQTSKLRDMSARKIMEEALQRAAKGAPATGAPPPPHLPYPRAPTAATTAAKEASAPAAPPSPAAQEASAAAEGTKEASAAPAESVAKDAEPPAEEPKEKSGGTATVWFGIIGGIGAGAVVGSILWCRNR